MRWFRCLSVQYFLDVDDLGFFHILRGSPRVDDSQAEVAGVVSVRKLDVLG